MLATTAKSGLPPQNLPPTNSSPFAGIRLLLTFAAFVLLALLLSNAKKLRTLKPARLLLASAVLTLVTLGMAACGSKHVRSGGTPVGAYTVTVTATSGSVSHSSTAQLTVQ